MANELNKFLKEFKTIVESGYVKNGRQFLGTGVSGVFRVNHFDGTTIPFEVKLKKPTADELSLAPFIAIHSITPDLTGLIGGNKDTYTFNVEMFFTTQEATVDAALIREEELARYFLEEMNHAIDNCRDQFTTVRVMSLNRLPGITQEGRYNNTTIFGFTARGTVTLG